MSQDNDTFTPKVSEYLKDKQILVIEESSTLRTAVKQFLMSLGCLNNQINYAEAYSLGVDKINSIQPSIVFCSYQFETSNKNGFELYQIHEDLFPNRSDHIFLIISAKNNLTVTTQVSDLDIDGLILKPLTGESLKTVFFAAVKQKVVDPIYYNAIQKAKELIYRDELDEAFGQIDESMELSITPTMSYYFLGLAYQKKSDDINSIESLKKGIQIEKNHYKCLTCLFDLYIKKQMFREAASCGVTLYQEYPFNPRRIPDLIKSLVYVKNYQVIIEFSDLVKQEEDDIAPEHIPHLAAGLTIAGKLLLKEVEVEDAICVLENAARMSVSHLNIFSSIIQLLLEEKMVKLANKFFAFIQNKDTLKSHQYKIIEFELIAHSKKYKALQLVKIGSDLLAQNIKSPIIYKYLIEKSIQAKRKTDLIQDLIHECKKEFPDYPLKKYEL